MESRVARSRRSAGQRATPGNIRGIGEENGATYADRCGLILCRLPSAMRARRVPHATLCSDCVWTRAGLPHDGCVDCDVCEYSVVDGLARYIVRILSYQRLTPQICTRSRETLCTRPTLAGTPSNATRMGMAQMSELRNANKDSIYRNSYIHDTVHRTRNPMVHLPMPQHSRLPMYSMPTSDFFREVHQPAYRMLHIYVQSGQCFSGDRRRSASGTSRCSRRLVSSAGWQINLDPHASAAAD